MNFEKVAVTGGSGRLGRYVVAELAPHCDVTVLDLAAPDEGTNFERCDVLKPAELSAALAGQDAVVHLAGLDLDRDAAADAYLHVNAVGTWNVLEAAEAAGIRRVVQCSSVTATGLNEARPEFQPQYLPVDETHPVAPVHPYGVSKLLQEQIADSFNRRGSIEVISLRLTLVMFETALSLVEQRLRDPMNRWLYYYVSPRDAARAFHCALRAGNVELRTMFITGKDTCRREPTLDWYASSFGAIPEIKDPDHFDRNPQAAVFDGSRAREMLGFESMDRWCEHEHWIREA